MAQRELGAAANPEKARPMAAYMKTDMPLYGVQKPQRTVIIRRLIEDFEEKVRALWVLPHR